jgi:hypothetical protein
MLVIGNDSISITNHGKGHWILQLADYYKEEPTVIVTESNEDTFQAFIKHQQDHKNIVVMFHDLVHQKIGNFVYNWSNDKYLDINFTRRRDMLLMTHTPDSLVEHNMMFYNAIKSIRKDAKITTEWAQISPCVSETLLETTTTPYFNKYSLSGQFIRWCDIHGVDIKNHAKIEDLIATNRHYNYDYTYTQDGHDAIFKLIIGKKDAKKVDKRTK